MIEEIVSQVILAAHYSDVELLTEQLKFLEETHKQVVGSYSALNNTFNLFVIALGSIVTIGGGLGLWTSIQALRNTIDEKIKEQLSEKVENRIQELEITLEKISILNRTRLYYYLPNAENNSCKEYEIIQAKLPNSVFKSSYDNSSLQNSNVVVLDLVNSGLDSVNSEGQRLAEDLIKTLPSWSTLILYTPTNLSPVFKALNDLDPNEKKVDYATANMKLTLMDRVIAAAYFSDSLKQSQH